MVSHLKKEMKVFYDCKLKPHESELKKQMIDQEKSLNKLIYKSIDDIDLPVSDKVRFLQIHRHDHKIDTLLTQLANKTENIKSVIDLEEKVRNDMAKASNKRSSSSVFSAVRGGADTSEIQEKINQKNLPEKVREEIQK